MTVIEVIKVIADFGTLHSQHEDAGCLLSETH